MKQGPAALGAALGLGLLLNSCGPHSADPTPRPTSRYDGGQGHLHTRIVNGWPVPAGELRGVVGLLFNGKNLPECTGTLIQPDIVLTATHCVCHNPNAGIVAYVGDGPPRPGEPLYRAAAYVSRARCGDAIGPGKDLAVVRLVARVSTTNPIMLADDRLVRTATLFQITGFGATDFDGTVYRFDKLFAQVRPNELTTAEIVAGMNDSSDTCLGDSGGPLLVAPNGGASVDFRTWKLAGVTSRAIDGAPRNCGYGTVFELLNNDARVWLGNAVAALRKAAATPH